MHDRLDTLFYVQRNFQGELGYDFRSCSIEERVEYTKEYVLAALDELHEVLGETSWKPWATGVKYNEERVQDELIDVLCFFLNLALVAGMTPAMLFDKYQTKMAANIERQRRGYRDGEKCPVCDLELDDRHDSSWHD